MDAPPPERPRAVTIVGWIWLIVASLRCLDGFLGLVVWKVAGLDRGLPFLTTFRGRSLRIEGLGVDSMMRHATEILVAQGIVAGFIAYAAFGLLRRRAWARTVIEAASWLGVAAMAGIGAYVYASTARLALESPAEAAQIRMAGIAAGAFIAFLGAAFFGGTAFLLRRPHVRQAFEPASAVQPR